MKNIRLSAMLCLTITCFVSACGTMPPSLDPRLSEEERERVYVERQFFAKYPNLPPSQDERVGQSPADNMPPEIPYYSSKDNPRAIFPTPEGRPWTNQFGMHIPRADESKEARAEWCREAVAKTIVKYYRSDAGAAMWFGNNRERSRTGANYMIEESIKGDLRVCLWIGYAHVDSQTRAKAAVAILEHAKRQDGERIKVAAQYYAEAAEQLSSLFGY